jgi:hypothetical protein
MQTWSRRVLRQMVREVHVASVVLLPLSRGARLRATSRESCICGPVAALILEVVQGGWCRSRGVGLGVEVEAELLAEDAVAELGGDSLRWPGAARHCGTIPAAGASAVAAAAVWVARPRVAGVGGERAQVGGLRWPSRPSGGGEDSPVGCG